MLRWQPHRLARTIGSTLLDALVPPRCPLCRAPVTQAHTLCAGCWRRLRLIDAPTCPASGLPLVGTPQAIAAYRSLPALAERAPWRELLAAAFHDGAARQLVHRLKYRDDHAPACLMARLMARRLPADLPQDAIIVPVPLHRRRLWARRYNQSMELARRLAALAGLACRPDVLLRTRPTRPQTGLTGRQRRRNLKGAFTVPPAKRQHLNGRHVLLVDDVLTTGSTARACTDTLLDAGAAGVRVVVFALASSRDALHI